MIDPTIEIEAQARAQGIGEAAAFRALIVEARELRRSIPVGYVRWPPLKEPEPGASPPAAILAPGEIDGPPIDVASAP